MLHLNEAPGVHRIEDAYTNFFLVETDDGVIVVDAGLPTSWVSLMQALPRIGRHTADLEAVVLTHAHFDHIGFAERARSELGVPVWVPAEDEHLTKKPLDYAHERSRVPYLLKPRAMPIVLALTANRAFFPSPIETVRTFTAAGSPEVSAELRVVPTPGHTFGHVSFHLPDRDAVIAGDALVTLNPYTGGTGPQIVAGAATADSAANLDSLGALAETGAGTLLVGHGEPWRDGAPSAVELAVAAGPS